MNRIVLLLAFAALPAAAQTRVQVFLGGHEGTAGAPIETVERQSNRLDLFCGRTHTTELVYRTPPGMQVVDPVAAWQVDNEPAAQDTRTATTLRDVRAAGTIRYAEKPGGAPLCGAGVLHLRFGLRPASGSKGATFKEQSAGFLTASGGTSRLTFPDPGGRTIDAIELAFPGSPKRVSIPIDASEERPHAFTHGKRRYLAWRVNRDLVLADITR